MFEDFHPGDLWQNKNFLEIVQSHRKIRTFQCGKYSILLYKMGALNLKTKIYISRDFTNKDIPALIEDLNKFKIPQIDIHCTNDFPFGKYFKNITYGRQATYLINLTLSVDDLFHNISGKRRNHIRKGLREGVKVSQTLDLKIFDQWWDIYLRTSERGGFTIQKKNLVWDALQLPQCRLFTAWHNKTLLAGNIIFTHNYPFYWLGASIKEFSRFNAPSLLQWNIIEAYHKEGFKLYDMGGAEFDSSHGPTQFKKSMGSVFFEYRQIQVIPNPRLSAFIKFSTNLYYKYLERTTW